MRRLYILSAIGIGLLVVVLASVAVFSPETLNNLLDPDRVEVVNVTWGNMVNRSTHPETTRWINFTIYNYGEDKDLTAFKLEFYDENKQSYEFMHKNHFVILHGENKIFMIGDITKNKYRLFLADKLIWENDLPQ